MCNRLIPAIALTFVTGFHACSRHAFAHSKARSNLTMEQLEDLSLRVDGVTLNNIIIARKESFAENKEYVNVEATLRNRNKKPRDVAVFIVCYARDGSLICCVSLKPGFDMMSEGSVTTLKGDYYVDEGDCAKIAKIDVRLVVR